MTRCLGGGGVDLESVQPDYLKPVLLELKRACANMKQEDGPNSLLWAIKLQMAISFQTPELFLT